MSLILEHVCVSVPDAPDTNVILDDLSMHVAAGEVVAVTGPSGSGKSTMLAVAGLLRRPDTGAVTIAGTPTAELSRAETTRLRGDEIGLVFQSSNLFPSLTALEQVELVAHIAGRLDAGTRARARELLVAVGLEQRLGNRPAQLSGGERQRVGIARALMNEPSLLLADEPTASLDERRGQEVMELLVGQAVERRIATVIVTHHPQQLTGATSWVTLDSGRRVDRDDPATV